MQSGLATITIVDDAYSEHVAYELSDQSGLIFARQELLVRGKGCQERASVASDAPIRACDPYRQCRGKLRQFFDRAGPAWTIERLAILARLLAKFSL